MAATGTADRAGARWPAIVVVLLLAVLVGAITILARSTPGSTRTADPHETVTLTADAESTRVDPIPGWQIDSQSDAQLVLTHRGDRVSVTALTVTGPPPSAETLFQRRARLLTVAHIAATQESVQRTRHGYAGGTGTAVGDDRIGRLSVLRQADRVVSVLVLAAPERLDGYQPQLSALYDSISGANT
ncbi:hypothetical protein Athai_18870 [Actinocatenispora thailandica]|uniref:Uncharacterized protein n=1 Tax=Actinocatenispora thailandica TaxID=227318 RepID=A0A7R7HWV5_9ACTN|nr:hypothetical protein [Actinocatenispora thailandica]BCJ34384.1 hypothetical protein Athai_18870 [Actinocatenispora thailandica]